MNDEQLGDRSPAGTGRWASRQRIGLIPMLAFIWGCGAEGEIEQPLPLYGEEPVHYPLQLWDEGVEGETILRVRVTDTGVVDSVEVVESSGHHGLDSAAVSGVRDLRFQPGRQNGKRVRMWATLPVVFSRRPSSEGL